MIKIHSKLALSSASLAPMTEICPLPLVTFVFIPSILQIHDGLSQELFFLVTLSKFNIRTHNLDKIENTILSVLL